MHWLNCIFRMRHETGHVAGFVADTGDVPQRTVGVIGLIERAGGVAILPENLAVALEFFQRGFVGKIAALAVGDGEAKNLAFSPSS